MAIIRLASNRYVGLSIDTKPTTNVELGAFFTESDTGSLYTWTGAAWLNIPLDHKNIAPGNIHVPYDFIFPDAITRTAYVYVPADIGKFIRQQDSEDIYMLTNNSPATFVKVSGSGSGEPNTASNQGSVGVGWFIQKSVFDLQFKNIETGSSKLSIFDDSYNNVVIIDLEQDEIDADTLIIDFVPSGYTRQAVAPFTINSGQLTSHLNGIDSKFVSINSVISNLDFVDNGNRAPVRLATVAPLPAYTPLGSGVGKKLQANANGALTVDSVGVVTGNRVLIKNETGASAIHNGIYSVVNPGDASNKYVLERVTDYDESDDVFPGHLVQSSEGAINADEIWILTSDAPIVLESSHLYYSAIKTGLTASVPVAAAANIAVDSILLSQTHTAKWVVDIYDATAGLRESSEVLARENNLNTAFTQVNAIGDTLSYVITFTSNGVSMSFNVQNTGANTITVRLRKLEA